MTESKRRWNGGNGNERSRTLTSAVDYTFEYTLACGCTKRRKETPVTSVGSTSFCWNHHASSVVLARDVVILGKARRRP